MIKYLCGVRFVACTRVAFVAAHGFAAAGDLGRADPNFWDGLFPKQLYLGPVAPLSFPPADVPHSLYTLNDDEAPLREQSFSILQLPQHREVWKTLMDSWVQATAFPRYPADRPLCLCQRAHRHAVRIGSGPLLAADRRRRQRLFAARPVHDHRLPRGRYGRPA